MVFTGEYARRSEIRLIAAPRGDGSSGFTLSSLSLFGNNIRKGEMHGKSS
jgi:hypothetical protein